MAALCEFFRIGRIVRPHGVHGAVKLEPLSDSLARYKGLKEAYNRIGRWREGRRGIYEHIMQRFA